MKIKKQNDSGLETHLSKKNVAKQKFESSFLKYFDDKWDNLFLFHNGFMLNFVADKSVQDYLSNPKDKKYIAQKTFNNDTRQYGDNSNKNSFVEEFKKTFKSSKNFEIYVHSIYNREEETAGFSFALKPTTTAKTLHVSGNYTPKKDLVVKLDPLKKTILEIQNTEQIFLEKEFNVVDFSKANIDNNNFIQQLTNIFKNSADPKKINQNKHLKAYNNLDFKKTYEDITVNLEKRYAEKAVFAEKYVTQESSWYWPWSEKKVEVEGIREKIIFTKDKERNFFSKTIGFSVKTLTINDMIQVPSNFVNAQNVINGSFHSDKEAAAEGYTRLKEKFMYSKGNAYLYTKETYKRMSLKGQNSKNIENSLYTMCYFSPFSVKKDTCLKKIYSSRNLLEARRDPNNLENSLLNKSDLEMEILTSVSILSKEKLKEKTKDYRHRLGLFQPKSNPSNSIEKINKKVAKVEKINKLLNAAKSSMDYLTDIEVKDNILYITLNFLLLESFEDVVLNNKTFENAHFFTPRICLETINDREGMLEIDSTLSSKTPIWRSSAILGLEEGPKKNSLKALFSKIPNINKENKSKQEEKAEKKPSYLFDNTLEEDNFDDGDDVFSENDLIIAYRCNYVYKINIDDIFARVEIRNPKSLRSISKLYGSKYFFTDSEHFSYSFEEKSVIGKDSIKSKFPSSIPDYSMIELGINTVRGIPKNVEAVKSLKPLETGNSYQQKVDNSLTNPPEKVLKVTKEEPNFNQVNPETVAPFSGIENLQAINKAVGEMEKEGLISSYFELNNINKENPKGKRRATGTKNVRYVFGYNCYGQRRGNIQPRLIKILDEAFKITKKRYPELLKVEIMSGGTMPIDIWANIMEILSKNLTSIHRHTKNQRQHVASMLENMNIFVNATSDETYKKDITKLIKRDRGGVHDTNHSLGFGCDVYLKRSTPTGTKYVCLYEPNDEKDFLIVRFFIDCCFKLGVSSAGAGMFYMHYPDIARYYSNTKVANYKKGLKQYNGKYILDHNNVPLRTNNGKKKRNAIHLDISQMNNIGQAITTADPDYFNKIALYVQNYKSIKSQFASNHHNSRKDDPNYFYLEKLKSQSATTLKSKIKSRTTPTSRKTVWGRDGKSRFADDWLLNLAGKKATANEVHKVKEINSTNSAKIALDQFKDMTKKHGKNEDYNYVQISQILKQS